MDSTAPLGIRPTYLPFGQPNFAEAEIAAVSEVLRSGWVGLGPQTHAFERELAAYVGAENVVAVNSCTSALFLALKTIGVGPGDEVVVPTLTWCSTANAVLYLGATPVFCDVDLDTMSASPATMAAAITANTKAVIHVHYGGLAGDMVALRAALPANVAIVEDAAHALGALYPDGSPVGSSGNLVCFSFYANKNLSTGDGGAIACRDPALSDRIRLTAHQGLSSDAWKRYSHPMAALTPGIAELGYKMNFTDLQASIGRVQLKRQPEFAGRRHRVAEIYHDRLAVWIPQIRFQKGVDSPSHARHLFVIRVPLGELEIDRNEMLLELRARNIGASIHYAPLHTLPLYRPWVSDGLPHAEELALDIMTLPIGASVTDADCEYVVANLLEVLAAASRQQ